MKALFSFLGAVLLMAASASATTATYDGASVTGVIYAVGSNGLVKATPVSSAHVLATEATKQGLLPSQVALIFGSDKIAAGFINRTTHAELDAVLVLSGSDVTAELANTAQTDAYATVGVTVTINGDDYTGTALVHLKSLQNKITYANCTIIAGSGNKIFRGTVVTTKARFTF